MSKFYFGGPSSVASTTSLNATFSDDDEDTLPYPLALPRSDFLAPNFSAPSYLSTLSHRHQTLEDLRSDLRERSQALSKELLDLVNANYEQFLSLGADLQGGEERVEDVRVGLLGFRRGVEEVRRVVGGRRAEVEGLIEGKRACGREIAVGRGLLEIDGRLEELEERLMVASLGRMGDDEWSTSESEEEEDWNKGAGTGTGKLQILVEDFRRVERLMKKVGVEHPFIVAQQERLVRVRNTILLDLGTALKQSAAGLEEVGKNRLIRILGIYRDFGAESEAVKVLKDLRSR
ncbi:hypothetical protein QTJ16_006630 [Diplocarpon rosae]|uniref:Conserved oligomeric Golgi complex subunit 2 n=1 Tax=Diplocarpon rosae TaxID=946125 RepID=A0AAD9SUS4_9HELO|nr:hypothetical protein QTJ16_006630 [Diplocarpon rosae]